jgi:SnoaL-like domain
VGHAEAAGVSGPRAEWQVLHVPGIARPPRHPGATPVTGKRDYDPPRHQPRREWMSTTRAKMFADIDRMDVDAWAGYLAEDVAMRFGNGDPVHGRQGCRDALAAFYDTINGVRHDIVEQWENPPATIVESNITYTRKDGRGVTVPCVTIYRVNTDDLIEDYRIFIDIAPVIE